MIEDEQIVRLRIPAMARSGSIFEMPLPGLGGHTFYLRLHVFVERTRPMKRGNHHVVGMRLLDAVLSNHGEEPRDLQGL